MKSKRLESGRLQPKLLNVSRICKKYAGEEANLHNVEAEPSKTSKTPAVEATSPSNSSEHSTTTKSNAHSRTQSGHIQTVESDAIFADETVPSAPEMGEFEMFQQDANAPPFAYQQDFVLRGASLDPSLADSYPRDDEMASQVFSRSPTYAPAVPNVVSRAGQVPDMTIPRPDNDDDDDVEVIPRGFNDPEQQDQWYYDMGMDPASTVAFPGNLESSNSFALFREPVLPVGSPEMIVMKFDQKTSSILSVRDGPTENPWRTLLWPLATQSPALYHALLCMTSFHSARQIPELRMHGITHLQKSINALRTDFHNVKTEAALATTIALAFAESWDNQIKTGIHHVKGAKALVNRALVECRHKPIRGLELKRLKFLCKAWIYMDVITRLTCVDDDISNDAEDVANMMSGPLEAETEVDPLLGCASSLFPVIGRVANLVRKVCKIKTNTDLVIDQALELKFALENWQAPPYFEPPEDPDTYLEHSLQTAEAYRWSTMLYLQQAVPEIPMLSSGELARRTLVCLANVPVHSRTITVQFFPLFAAGCEALEPRDRKWVTNRWDGMSERLTIGNVDRCADVVKEVWRRRDEYHGRPSSAWNRFSASAHLEALSADFAEFQSQTGTNQSQTLFAKMGDPQVVTYPRQAPPSGLTELDFEYTVRGRLHWVSVMRDWNWEGQYLFAVRREQLLTELSLGGLKLKRLT